MQNYNTTVTKNFDIQLTISSDFYRLVIIANALSLFDNNILEE